MSASNEIRFKIGADTSALSRGFVQAQSIAASAASQIKKKFDLKEGFRSGVLALGLSVENISEKIAEMFTGGAQESWKSALESAKEAERIIEETTLRRMSTLRQIEKLENDIARNARERDATPKKNNLPSWLQGLISGAKASGFVGMGIGSLIENQLGGESPSAAHDRSQAEQLKDMAKQARADELKEKAARDQARVDAAFLDVVRLTMTEQEKALALQNEMVAAQEKLTEAQRKGKDTTEAELEVLRKQKALEEQLLKIEKDQTEEDKKKADARKQFIDKYKNFLNAEEAVEKAKANVRDARHDALAMSLDQAAGKGANPSDRAKARAILRDEARARSLFASGRTVTEFNSATQRNEQRGAAFFQNRAEQMRGGFDKLKTDEQRPFAGVEDALKEANQHLYEMEKLLTPEEV